MKKIAQIIVAMSVAILASGCSHQDTVSEAKFNYYFSGKNCTMENETIQLHSDNTGVSSIVIASGKIDWNFTWEQSGTQLILTPDNDADSLGSFNIFDNYEYRDGYIVPTECAWTGKVPSKGNFSATLKWVMPDGRTQYREFCKDGTVSCWVDDFADSKSIDEYKRNGDFIIVTWDGGTWDGDTRYFLVADGTMYTSYFCPVDKLPENL